MPRGKAGHAEHIIPKLREVEVELGRGKTVAEAAEALAASNITYVELIGLKTLSAGTARARGRRAGRFEHGGTLADGDGRHPVGWLTWRCTALAEPLALLPSFH